jgi:hypothetical protein
LRRLTSISLCRSGRGMRDGVQSLQVNP